MKNDIKNASKAKNAKKNRMFFILSILLLVVFVGVQTISAGEEAKAKTEKSADAKAKTKTTAKSTVAKSEGIEWLTYEEGLKVAEETGKHIVIDFSTAWCGFCKKMERETFTNNKVIDLINNEFIPVRIDGDSRRKINLEGFMTTERNLTKTEYGVRGYPTFWFLESDGQKIGAQPGYQPPAQFLSLLNFVKDRKYEKKIEVSADSPDQSK